MKTIRIYATLQGPNRYFGGWIIEDRENNVLTNNFSSKVWTTKQEALTDAKAHKKDILLGVNL